MSLAAHLQPRPAGGQYEDPIELHPHPGRVDAALRAPAGPVSISAEVEANWAGYSNDAGVAHVAGGRAQV